ncbi:MAG TPA: hypothetical protein VKB46_25750 [Pyrinomonadaceae bacterium]|nr:hypothetical protein [Pyrinomonadaceae bacterium]
MSTPAKELIAIAEFGFIENDAAKKQLATIFNRIAFPAFPLALRHNAAHWSMLVDQGILHEYDIKKLKTAADGATRNSEFSLIEDFNEMIRPLGTSVEEMLAARNDPEELKRIKEKVALPVEEIEAKIPDHERAMQTIRRVSVNTTRLFAIAVRKQENPDAYATVRSGDSSLDDDDQRPNKHDVLKIVVVVPVPDEQTSWQQIIQYRNDPDSQGGFIELKEWMSDLARGAILEAEAQHKLESLLDQYRRVLQRHEIQINWAKLEAFVVASADYAQRFAPFSASPLFWVEPRKLALLEGESTLPGSIVAFVTEAKSMFDE